MPRPRFTPRPWRRASRSRTPPRCARSSRIWRALSASGHAHCYAPRPKEPQMRKAKAKPVNAVDLLMEDHEYVRKSFKQFEKIQEKADGETLRGIVEQVCQALKAHTKVEEEIFYPAV